VVSKEIGTGGAMLRLFLILVGYGLFSLILFIPQTSVELVLEVPNYVDTLKNSVEGDSGNVLKVL